MPTLKNQKHFYSLPEIKRVIRAANNDVIPTDEFIVQKRVDDELSRLKELHYVFAGEDAIIDHDEFRCRAMEVLLNFGSLVIKARARPKQLVLERGYKPDAFILVTLCWLCDTADRTCGSNSTPATAIVSILQGQGNRTAPELSSDLCSFIEFVQDFADLDRFPEIDELDPQTFATLALRRWLRLGVVVSAPSETTTASYDLSEELKLADAGLWEVTASMLMMPELQCDPSTGRWTIRPEYARRV